MDIEIAEDVEFREQKPSWRKVLKYLFKTKYSGVDKKNHRVTHYTVVFDGESLVLYRVLVMERIVDPYLRPGNA